MLKRTEVITVRETYPGSLIIILTYFLRFLNGGSFRKSLQASEWHDRFQLRKIPKIFKHVSYPIRYCKISLLMDAGRSSLLNARPFLTHPIFQEFLRVQS